MDAIDDTDESYLRAVWSLWQAGDSVDPRRFSPHGSNDHHCLRVYEKTVMSLWASDRFFWNGLEGYVKALNSTSGILNSREAYGPYAQNDEAGGKSLKVVVKVLSKHGLVSRLGTRTPGVRVDPHAFSPDCTGCLFGTTVIGAEGGI